MPLAIPLAAERTAVALGALQGTRFVGAFTDRRIDVLVGVGLTLGRSVLRDLPARGWLRSSFAVSGTSCSLS